MSLKRDVERTKGLEDGWQPGLQALRADRARVSASSTRALTGSVDVDRALRRRFRHASRWDYVVGWKRPKDVEFLHWIEVHPAGGSRMIGEVAAKLAWLREWLNGEGRPLRDYNRRFVWIASGRSGFRAGSPQSKRIASLGLVFSGNHYALGDVD